MRGDRHVDNLSAVVGEDDEDKEQPEGDGRDNEEVGRHNLIRMISEKRSPRLRWWTWMPAHIGSDGRLTHRDP